MANPASFGYWEEAFALLQAERVAASAEALQDGARVLTRAAAVDTAALEGFYEVDRGFTFSVAHDVAAWQVRFAEKGEAARTMFEAQLRAFELVVDVATGGLPDNEAVIRSLHELACSTQDTYRVWTAQGWQEQTLERGSYKRFPNNPSIADGSVHAYAPVDAVAPEMERFVRELREESFLSAPAPAQAAYAHYCLAAIHPFADGNGRVARALASVYLVRATSVPLVIFADHKPRYLDALAAADEGDFAAVQRFVADRSIDAMNMLAASLRKARTTSTSELRERARRLHYATSSLTHGEIDALADRLLGEAEQQLKNAFLVLDLGDRISLRVRITRGDSRGPRPGYRRLGRPDLPLLEVVVTSAGPAAAKIESSVRPLIFREAHPEPVRLDEHPFGEHFHARIEDLTPEIAGAVHFRLRIWAETLLARMLEKLSEHGNIALERSGWGG